MSSDVNVKVDLKYAMIGGSVSFIVVLIATGLIGGLTGADALQLAKTTVPNIRSLCGTLVLALGTMLALMLTLLSFGTDVKVDIDWSYYQRIYQLSFLTAVTLVAAVIVYLLLNIPIIKTDIVSTRWYTIVYYTAIALGSLLAGAFITVTIYLYKTIGKAVEIFDPDRSHEVFGEKEN